VSVAVERSISTPSAWTLIDVDSDGCGYEHAKQRRDTKHLQRIECALSSPCCCPAIAPSDRKRGGDDERSGLV